MMTEMRKGDEPIEAQKEYRKKLESKCYHIFKFIRNNSSPREGIPVVLTHPKFNLTGRKIVNELKELGSEFLDCLKI